MQPNLKGFTVALLGGDAREAVLAERLAAAGACIRAVGQPLEGREGIEVCREVSRALEGSRAVILPVPGINDSGELYSGYKTEKLSITEEQLSLLPAGAPVLVGVARPKLREMVDNCGLRLVEMMCLDEVAILNSIPSAEGAIQLAMENSDITIHGSSCFVLGFGRTGMTLARALHGLGAETTVVARSPAQRARAREMGLRALDFEGFLSGAAGAEFLFNTVPAMVLDDKALGVISPGALVIDLASSPGGTDFASAGRRGIKAILAPGLPGKVAPRTAGIILADVIARILMEEPALR